MERSVFGSAIKTYPSKRNRFSSYRPSSLFKDDDENDLFDQLLKDEEKRQPLSQKTNSDKPLGSVRKCLTNMTNSQTRSCIKNSYTIKDNRNGKVGQQIRYTIANSPTFKKKKKVSINLRRDKECNWKFSSRLFASDSDSENRELSIYDWSYIQSKTTANKKKSKRLKNIGIKQRNRCETPKDSRNNSKENCSSTPWNSATVNQVSNLENDEIQFRAPSSIPKTDEMVFKKPEPFVERSSDLFYQEPFRNQGQCKTRKKLSFVNQDQNQDDECEATDWMEGDKNNYSMRISITRKNVENELFDSDAENDQDRNFNPPIVSTPNRLSIIPFKSSENLNDEEDSKILQSLSKISSNSDVKCSKKLENMNSSRDFITNFLENEDKNIIKSPSSSLHQFKNLSISVNTSCMKKPSQDCFITNQDCGISVIPCNDSFSINFKIQNEDPPINDNSSSKNYNVVNEDSILNNLKIQNDNSFSGNSNVENEDLCINDSQTQTSDFSSNDSMAAVDSFSNNSEQSELISTNSVKESEDSFKNDNSHLSSTNAEISYTQSRSDNLEIQNDCSSSKSHESKSESSFENYFKTRNNHPSSESSVVDEDLFSKSQIQNSGLCSNTSEIPTEDSKANNSKMRNSDLGSNICEIKSEDFIENLSHLQNSDRSASIDEIQFENSISNNSKIDNRDPISNYYAINDKTKSEVSSRMSAIDLLQSLVSLSHTYQSFHEKDNSLKENSNELSKRFSKSDSEIYKTNHLEKSDDGEYLVGWKSSTNLDSIKINELNSSSVAEIPVFLEKKVPEIMDSTEKKQSSIENVEKTFSRLIIDETHFFLNPNAKDQLNTKCNNVEPKQFYGWSNSEICNFKIIHENKVSVYQSLMKMFEPEKVKNVDCLDENSNNVTNCALNLPFVTARRKKKYVLPTVNEEEVDESCGGQLNEVYGQESQFLQPSTFDYPSLLNRTSMYLNGGKKWRRSFITLKNIRTDGLHLDALNDLKGRSWKKNVVDLISSQREIIRNFDEIEERSTITAGVNETIEYSSFKSIDILEKCNRPDRARFSLCLNVKRPDESGGSVSSSDNSKIFSEKSYASCENQSYNSKIDNCELEAGDYSRCSLLDRIDYDIRDNFSAREIVLRHCKQSEPLPFAECFNDRILLNCQKIGEGVYGEVFMLKRSRNRCSVLKIIPIEGTKLINGEKQKKFEEIVSELIISIELSNLRKRNDYFTDNFAEVQRCWCVYGKYPKRLLDLWNEYDYLKGSDNDSPKVFSENQLYIILELNHGGEDVESFAFNNAQQAFSVFTQVTNALAVAEQALMFEHRDLHWGNILVSKCKAKESKYVIRDYKKVVRLQGIKVTIIDYTLSRISKNNCVVFNDIGQDPELFTAEGDLQFEIYRMMRNEVNNVWNQFTPKTNIFWLHYLLDKMLNEIRYRRSNTKIHQLHVRKLRDLNQELLHYDGAYDLSCDRYFR